MNRCPSFESCSAPLCPLDPEIEKRLWYAGEEPVCTSRTYGQHRWIRKQRSILRRHTKSWFGVPVTYRMLFEASRPKQLTEAQRDALRQRFTKVRKPQPAESFLLSLTGN